jgi:hypothetical protein
VSETRSLALLEDIARLLRKHGPRTFSDLSALLQDPIKIQELTIILETGASVGRKVRASKTGAPHPQLGQTPFERIDNLISRIRTTDPERARVLSNFYEDLTAKRVLPALREVREFARENRLAGVGAGSREKAIGPLIRGLSSVPSDLLKSIIERAHVVGDRTDDRSLERWAEVILDKNRSRGGA